MDNSTKTLKELIAICKEKGVKGYTGKKRDELLEMILHKESVPVEMNNPTAWVDYESLIKTHSNYTFLPEESKKTWVVVSKGDTNPRKSCWDTKKNELVDSGQIPQKSAYVNVARYIHPTKKHVCKKCGKESSIYYHYPTAGTWKWLKTAFNFEKMMHATIFEIYEMLRADNKSQLFAQYFGMSKEELETVCSNDKYTGNKLSPGVMSNAPDRLDGFHCYNSNCGCRTEHDKGRSAENMKSYTRDRRAYENLSDGRVLLANCLMGKLNTIEATCFICHKICKMTADHIGPISLGFVHDPVNFQACCNPCNIKKRNRISEQDVEKIKSREESGETMVSWWAKDTWDRNKCKAHTTLRKNLDNNAKKFLLIIDWLKKNKHDGLELFITENYINHDNSYSISDIAILPEGEIRFQHHEEKSVKKTKDKQKERTKQVLMELNEKLNRKIKLDLSEQDLALLSAIDATNFKHTICTILRA